MVLKKYMTERQYLSNHGEMCQKDTEYEKTPTMVSFRTWHASVDVKRRKDTSVSETRLGVE